MKLTRKTVFGIKTETTQSSVIAMTATDFMLVEGLTVTPVQERINRDFYRSTLSPITTVLGKRSVEVKFKAELKYSGTAGTAYAPMSAILQACGLAEAVSGGSNVTYAPTSAPASANYYGPGKSASIACYFDGVFWSIAGAMGTFKLTGTAGNIAMLDVTMKGLYTEPTDVSFPSQTYLSQLPAYVQSGAFSMHTYSAICSKFEIDSGNTVSERADVSSANGLKGFVITGRRFVGSVDPEYDTVANFNFLNKLTAGTEAAYSVAIGATAGNICTITASKVQISDVKLADRAGIRIADTSLLFNQSSGDDEISIAFT